MNRSLRVGILGAAWIAPLAIIEPARRIPQVQVTAIATRDPKRAKRFALQHGIPRVHGSYRELLSDPDLDAVYNPLPNSLHLEWTEAALAEGKHVLCEKPLGLNVNECRRMQQAATRSGLVLAEAIHYCYHPMYQRVEEILTSGILGPLQQIETYCCFPIFRGSDIRYSYELGGGATMDLGVYAIHLARQLARSEPRVLSAEARLYRPQVDRWMAAELAFPGGIRARSVASMGSTDFLRWDGRVTGETGDLRIVHYPSRRLELTVRSGRTVEDFRGTESTYFHQLKAFLAAIEEGRPMRCGLNDAIANQEVLDAIYERAGLAARGTTA